MSRVDEEASVEGVITMELERAGCHTQECGGVCAEVMLAYG